MTNEDFFDPEYRKFMLTDYEDIRYRRKQLKTRPTEIEMLMIKLEKQFESFYRKFL